MTTDFANFHTTLSWTVQEPDFNPAERDLYRFLEPKPKWWQRFTVQTVPPSILVVDISHYNAQGLVDFDKLVASGVKGVILKCSESDWYKDTVFERNWPLALDRGLAVMVYHFHRGNKTGKENFDWFMECAADFLAEVEGSTAVALDCETVDGVDKDTRAASAFNFCQRARDAGLLDSIYCSPGLVPTLFPLNDGRWDALTWQWVAHWTSAADYTLPNGWDRAKVKCWQYGIYPTYPWAEKVEGAGTVDVNHMFLPTQAELLAWLGQDGTTPPVIYPFTVTALLNTVVRTDPEQDGGVEFALMQDTDVSVSASELDMDDNLWLFIGSGWIRARDTESY